MNEKKRTNFSLKDIDRFIRLLDGEDIVPENYLGRVSKFMIRITCPVRGHFYNKEFIMIFDMDYDLKSELHVITVFPGW